MPDSAWYLQPEGWRGGEGGSKTGALWISMAKMSVASSPPRLRSHDRRMRQLARCYLSCCTQYHPWCCRVSPPMVLHRMTSLVLHQKLLRIAQIIWNTHHILCTERFLYLFHPTIYANRLCSISINMISSTTDYFVTACLDRLSCHKYFATDFPQNAVPEFHFGLSYHLKFKVCVLIEHLIITI